MISIYLVKLWIEVHIDAKGRIEVLEQGMLHVFLRKQSLVCRNLPINTKAFVLDADTSVSLWGIEVIALVLEDGGFAQYGKAVGKTSGNEELTMVVLCKLYCYMLTIGG